MRMKNKLINMIYLFAMFGLIGNWYPVNAQLYNIDTLREFAADSYDAMKSIYDKHPESTPSTADILDQMQDIVASIEKWDSGFKKKVEANNPVLLGLPPAQGFDLDVHNLTEYIVWIDELYGEFKEYVKTPDSLDEDTAGELLTLYTSDAEEDLISTISDIFSIVSPEKWGNHKSSLLFNMAREIQDDDYQLCDITIQQIILDYYSAIIITEMRALTMIDFGYLMKGFKENVSYKGDIKKAKTKFVTRVEKYVTILRRSMKIAGKRLRPCDSPGANIRDESFYEFERFMQVVVANEMILMVGRDCSGSCESAPKPTKMRYCDGIACHNGMYVCQGDMRYCNSLNSAADFCENNDDEPRRYQWVKDGWGIFRPGDATDACNRKYHWPRAHTGMLFVNCDICRCLCSEDALSSPSRHFISLRDQLSDVANNMIIVGLKFRIVGKILHIDIQQGPLGQNGTIDENKVQWKAAEDIQYDMGDSTRSGKFKFYKNNGDDDREEMIANKDVAVLTFEEPRIYLDSLMAPSNRLITGIRFGRKLKEPRNPIYLEIQATPFDFHSGNLRPEESLWIGPKDTHYGLNQLLRAEYLGEGWRNPEKSKETVVDTKPNTFIDVTWSSWDEDASQTVLPFLDGRAVSFNPPTGLAGVSLYHRSEKGYGGFLSFALEKMHANSIIKNSF